MHRLCRMAGIPRLAPTVNLGMNLSDYVSINNQSEATSIRPIARHELSLIRSRMPESSER